MKKNLTLLLSLSMLFSLNACKKQDENTSTTSTVSSSTISSSSEVKLPQDNLESYPKVEEDIGFAIHYNRKDAKYTKWNLWLWENGGDGADYSFTGLDNYGAVARYTFEDFSLTAIDNGIGFIVKQAKTWSEGAR